MVRAVKNIVDDIKNKIRTEGVSADDIVALFEEAYSSLASDNNLRRGQLQSLYSTVNNVLANNKQLFSEEDRNYIRNMRDTEGAAVKKEPVVEIAPEEVVVEHHLECVKLNVLREKDYLSVLNSFSAADCRGNRVKERIQTAHGKHREE